MSKVVHDLRRAVVVVKWWQSLETRKRDVESSKANGVITGVTHYVRDESLLSGRQSPHSSTVVFCTVYVPM